MKPSALKEVTEFRIGTDQVIRKKPFMLGDKKFGSDHDCDQMKPSHKLRVQAL